jgi:hypothetical protein
MVIIISKVKLHFSNYFPKIMSDLSLELLMSDYAIIVYVSIYHSSVTVQHKLYFTYS